MSDALVIYEDLRSAGCLDSLARGDIEEIILLLDRVVACEPGMLPLGARLRSRLARILEGA